MFWVQIPDSVNQWVVRKVTPSTKAHPKKRATKLLVIKRIGEIDHCKQMISQYADMLGIHEGKTLWREQEWWTSVAAQTGDKGVHVKCFGWSGTW
jgi:hypothetical protein